MLKLKGITKKYIPKKGVPVEALRGIDLEIEDKGMVFILGKSGSGKSTLLNIIGGLDSADSGEIIIEGKSTKGFNEKDYDNYRNTYIGFVFQEYNILNEFSVGENISLAIELQNEKKNKERVEEILKEVGLEGYGDRKPNELSGGQKQRVAIARALIKEPKIILADEPTGALDSETGKSIFELLKKLSEDKLVIVVSHDREFAENYGDRIIELADGEIVVDKEKKEINNIENKEKKENKEIKKGRLPYKRALAMGAKGLTKKRFRLAITIILCFLSFAAFGFADVIVGRDKVKAGAEALYNSNDNYISFEKIAVDNNEMHPKVSDQALREFREKTGIDFQGVQDLNLCLPLNNGDNSLTWYYTGQYNYFPASKELFEEAGFDLYGRLPLNKNEVVITKYIYEQFAVYGMYYFEGDERKELSSEEIGSIDNFLAKKATLDGRKIVGIVDTHADPNGKLSWLKDIDGTNLSSYNEYECNRIKENHFLYSYHSMVFIDAITYENEYAVKPIRDTTGFGKKVSCSVFSLTTFSGAAPESSLKYADKIIWLDGKGERKELGENEIVIGIEKTSFLWPSKESETELQIPSGYDKTFIDGIVSFEGVSINGLRFSAFFAACCMDAEKISSEELNVYKKYCINQKKVFKDSWDFIARDVMITDLDFAVATHHPEMMTERQWRLSYACYLAYERDKDSGYYSNITGRMTGQEIERKYSKLIFIENRLEQAFDSIENVADENYFIKFSGSDYLVDEVGFTEPPSVVGIYIPKEGYPDDYVINDKIYEQSQYYENGIYDFIIAPLPHDMYMMEKVSELYYNPKGKIQLTCINIAFDSIIRTQTAMATIQPYVSWGSAILGIFCLLLLGNYIGYSVTSRKKEIGIIRAMGAKRSDIFAIFINEGVIITAIILVLAVIGVIAMCAGINTLIPQSYGIEITLLKFGIRQIALMTLVGYGATLLASAIPMYKLSRKKPVDIINNK